MGRSIKVELNVMGCDFMEWRRVVQSTVQWKAIAFK